MQYPPEAIVAAFERVRGFIREELETRRASLLPTTDTGDESYIDSAKAALRAADQLGIYFGHQTGTPEVSPRQARQDSLNLVAVAVVTGYDYNPGDSDLDNEQPISVRMTLGDFRRARNLVLVSGEKR